MIYNTFDNKSDQDYLVKINKGNSFLIGIWFLLHSDITRIQYFDLSICCFIIHSGCKKDALFNKIKLYKNGNKIYIR